MKFLPILLVFACIGNHDCLRRRSAVLVNWKFCKHPRLGTEDDFTFIRFRTRGDTSNPLGSKVTPGFVDEFLGLITIGISVGCIDFARRGLIPPHTHPRASEILYVGFVTSNQLGHRLFTKFLHPGDAFVFPIGLIHFQLNIGKTKAVAFNSLRIQNPGIMTIANSIFGAQPQISVDVLMKAIQSDKKIIEYLQSQTWSDN